MISRLTGTIAHTDLKYVIVDVGGVGYKVHVTADTASRIGKNATLWTHLAVRDDALDLYGFSLLSELNFFELLIGISGIGPKTALGILNVASIGAIDNAIRSGDSGHLVKVGGIGKKMAEKIVMELRDKMDGMPESEEASADAKETLKSDSDTIEALKSLGYAPAEARGAVKRIDKSLKNASTGEKVKAALKILGM